MDVIRPRFLDALVLEELDGTRWRLVRELRYDSAVLGARIVVPAGRITDLASVPRVPFAYWLAGDTGRKAGVVHDELYGYRAHTRAEADAVFYEALQAEGLAPWQAAAMYGAVRLAGWTRW